MTWAIVAGILPDRGNDEAWAEFWLFVVAVVVLLLAMTADWWPTRQERAESTARRRQSAPNYRFTASNGQGFARGYRNVKTAEQKRQEQLAAWLLRDLPPLPWWWDVDLDPEPTAGPEPTRRPDDPEGRWLEFDITFYRMRRQEDEWRQREAAAARERLRHQGGTIGRRY